MNPLIKNPRTGFHDDILNRTAHYCKLISTKTTINNKLSDKYSYLLEQKGQREQQARRLKINDDLIKTLIDIDKRSLRHRSVNSVRQLRKRSLKNQYLQKQKSLSISEENVRLFKKILHPQTDFGQQQIRQFDSQVTKYSKLIKHPFREICQMDSQFYSTYRLQQFKTRLSPFGKSNQSSSNRSFQLKIKNKKDRKLKRHARAVILEKVAEDNPQFVEQS